MQQNNESINSLLYKYLSDYKDKTAFSIYDGKNLTDVTYVQFVEDILKTAGYFFENKIKNKHIAIMLPDSYDCVVTLFAINITGNVSVMINYNLPQEEIEWQCKKTDVSFAVTSEDIKEKLSKNNIECVESSILRKSTPMRLEDTNISDPDALMMLVFTSGTTGKSKAVEITEKQLLYSVASQESFLNKSNKERTYFIVPLFHIAGIDFSFNTLFRGNTMCVGRGAKYMMQDLPVLNPNFAFLVPSMAEAILLRLKIAKTQKDKKECVFQNLTTIGVGGAKISAELCKSLIEFGINVENGYAMTEMTGSGTRVCIDLTDIKKIGKPIGDMRCKVVDGELVFKGTCVMKGYYKDPEETAKVLKDGWLYTGDLGYIDEDGNVYITGRKKNVIILPNGENVSPEIVEESLGKSDAVRECMVYNDEKGICVDLYTENEEAARQAVKEYNLTVPKYRQIYKINIFSQPLEKNATGKIKRKVNKYV